MTLASPETGLTHCLSHPRWAGAGWFSSVNAPAMSLCVVPSGILSFLFKWNDMSRYSLFNTLLLRAPWRPGNEPHGQP